MSPMKVAVNVGDRRVGNSTISPILFMMEQLLKVKLLVIPKYPRFVSERGNIGRVGNSIKISSFFFNEGDNFGV